ncbi:MAG: hypothetical protein ACLQSR_11890 [Limisphaerales bacterium]
MKKSIALIFAASTLFLAGCCTTHHVTQWEYKVVPVAPGNGANPQLYPQGQEALMNGFGKEGWIFVNAADGYSYFKRPVK